MKYVSLNIILASFYVLFDITAGYTAELQSSRHFENTGGLLDRVSPLLVPDKNATLLNNITLDDRGQLSKRNGYTILNSTGALGPVGSAVTGGGYHNAASGSSFFGLVVGSDVYRTGNTFSGSYTKVTGTVTVTNSASNLAQTTSFQDKLVFCNESDKPFTLSSTGNAVHISTSLFSGAKTCATYGSYLIVGNTTESSVAQTSRVRWSDVNNTDSFPANNYWDVEANDGDKIVSLVAFDDSVYIFKKRSIHRLIITGQEGANAFVVRPIARNIGAWAKNSVKAIPNVGIVFLAQNTVYVLSGNELEPIGDGIQRTIDGINRSAWANSVGEVYPKRYQYWLAVSPSGSTNNKVLVYDYIQKAWTVYSGMTVNALAQAEDSTGDNILLSGDSLGNHYKQDTGTSDNPANVETEISASYTSNDITFGAPEITKTLKYLYLFSLVDATTTVTTNLYYDYDGSAVENSIDLNLGQTGAVYDVAIYDQDVYPNRQYKVSRVELNRSARSVKIQFTNASADSLVGIIGWVFVYTLEDYQQ